MMISRLYITSYLALLLAFISGKYLSNEDDLDQCPVLHEVIMVNDYYPYRKKYSGGQKFQF